MYVKGYFLRRCARGKRDKKMKQIKKKRISYRNTQNVSIHFSITTIVQKDSLSSHNNEKLQVSLHSKSCKISYLLHLNLGIYFARRRGNSRENNEQNQNETKGEEGKTTDEYLVAGRSMHWLPLSISFMATYISGTSLLGIPAEIYTFGFTYILACLSLLVATGITWSIFIPIFYRLKIVCSNEVSLITYIFFLYKQAIIS